jgi:hypothetical protein
MKCGLRWRSLRYTCSKQIHIPKGFFPIKLSDDQNINRQAIPEHGFEVLVYAAKHDFKTLADEAVEYCASVPIADVVDNLNTKYLRAYVSHLSII